MPCLEKQNLSELAEGHIKAQKAMVANLRTRRDELEKEEGRLSATGDEENPKLKQVREAVNHLRLELDGEVETPPGSRRFIKSPGKKTAEERVEVMALQYRDRSQFVFKDTTKADKERTASVFGLPTVEEMNKLKNRDIADAMMARASSLLLARNDSRNPVDYIDATGLNVKNPLANVIEHHHIYNNVYLNENGRVDPKSFRIRQDSTTGELTMDVIPSYWNAEEHGRNTQFIGLLDGMHSGNDPITHMHYYKFSEKEARPVKEKIKADIQKITGEAKNRATRLEKQLSTLQRRAVDPQGYEQAITSQIRGKEVEFAATKNAAKGIISKSKATLTPEQLERREAHDLAQKELKQLNKELEEHRTLSTIREDIERTDAIVRDLQARAKAIRLSDYPKGLERESKRLERQALEDQSKAVATESREKEKLLKEKGDVNQQIKDVQRKLIEQQKIANLSEQDAINMFEKQNGFFSFDKGSQEKADHTQYRPVMNEEITRYYVRETIDHIEREYGNNALSAIQSIARKQYQRNILERIEALQDKVKAT